MATHMGWEGARDQLKHFRDQQIRSSEEIVNLWDDVLYPHLNKLGDDLWMIHEQVCIAALDCGRLETAMNCIQALKSQFPSSMRVRRLQALAYEATYNFEKAGVMYDQLLEQDETNSMIRKRKIAVLKAQDRIKDAIKELNDYLKKFMSDYEAWLELCDLYLQEQDYTKATFCMEELIMSNPHSHLYHQKYAEIKYTQGGVENMAVARKYFSQSLKLNPNNMRSLFGLFLSASNVASSKSKDAKTKKDNIKIAAWAAEQISNQYKEKRECTSDVPNRQLALVEHLLDDLQITQAY